LHDHGEIVWRIWSKLNLAHRLELLLASSWCANLSDNDLLGGLTSLALTEAEELRLASAWQILHWHLSEAGGVTLKWHSHRALNAVQLDVGEDVAIGVSVESNQVAPFARGIDIVAHNLASSHLR